MRLSRVPDAVRGVATAERRLAWGLTREGLPLVATPTSLYAGPERLPWTSVERVCWEPPALTVVEVAQVEGTGRSRTWELTTDTHLAEVVRARVTASVGWSGRRLLSPSGAVRLVGRRVPGVDALAWQIVWQPGTDSTDPGLQDQAAQWVEALRRTIG